MRLLIITTYYPEYLRQFYAAQPDLAEQLYAVQHATLMADGNRWANFLSTELRKIGHETDDIVSNAEPLQKAWAKEHGIKLSTNGWMTDIVLAQIRQFNPEILFFGEWPREFDAAFVDRCRAICPNIRLVIGWCGEAHPSAAYFRNHDLVLSCSPDTVSDLQREGIKAMHLNHAFSRAVLDRLKTHSFSNSPTIPVGFVGQVIYGNDFHNERARLFDSISKTIPLKIFGSVEDLGSERPSPRYKRQLRQAYYAGLRSLDALGMGRVAKRLPRYGWYQEAQNRPVFTRLRQLASTPLFGLQMYEQLRDFSICLNVHGPSRFASNMRLFEATGVGTCLLTDWKDNLPDLFEPDTEVVTYRSAEECIEKVRYLLDYETERKAIAVAGQRRTLRDHTIAQRARVLDEIIKQQKL